MRFKRVLFVVASLLIGWGCSNSAEAVKNGGTPAGEPPVTRKTAQTASVTATPTPTSIGLKPREKKMVDAPASGPPPSLQFRQAEEDSEIATSMNANGEVVEIRVFKSHPQLVRAEAIWKSAKEATLKITLKGGKTIDVTTDRMTNLQSATARDLIEIAGIKVERRSGEKRP